MATRTVDLGSVIGPQGPAGAAGKDGMACRAARFVVGTSTAGWTEADCDYLCDGTADDVEINAAIQALPSAGGEVVILDGTYKLTSPVALNKRQVVVRGNGPATRLQSTGDEEAFTITNEYCTVRDLYAYALNAPVINITSGFAHVLNTVLAGANDGIEAIRINASRCKIIGNLIYWLSGGGIVVSGRGHVILGNFVYGSITSTATYSVIENNAIEP